MNEGEIAQFVQQIFISSPIGVIFAVILSRYWIFLFFPLLFRLGVYGSKKERHSAAEAGWTAGVALLIASLTSLLIMRLRPYLAVSDIYSLIPAPLTSSFPSSHTAISVAVTSALYRANRTAGHFALLITFGVIIGRIAAGVHYPTDILGGIAIGLLSFWLIRMGHHAVHHLT